MVENRNALIILSAISLITLAITVFFFPLKFILWMTPNAVLAFAYFFPQTRLRSIMGLKAIVIAFVWTMVTYVYPFLLDNFSLEKNWNGALERFLFLIPICIIFNVRDVEADRIAGVRTIPVIYGIKPSIITSIVSLLFFSALVFFNRGFSAEAIALTASAIITGILILKSSPHKDDYFYSFWVDGVIVLQFLLVWVIKL
jgi:4-hydroxybenzoate polyprenyltransferase